MPPTSLFESGPFISRASTRLWLSSPLGQPLHVHPYPESTLQILSLVIFQNTPPVLSSSDHALWQGGYFQRGPRCLGPGALLPAPRHPHPPHSRFPTGTLYTVIPLTVSCRRARQPLVLLTPPHQGVAWCWHSAQQLLRAGGGRGEGRPGPCWLSGRSLGRGAGRAQTPKM